VVNNNGNGASKYTRVVNNNGNGASKYTRVVNNGNGASAAIAFVLYLEVAVDTA
jgi:hypothetical protein